MIEDTLKKIAQKENLDAAEAEAAFSRIAEGQASEAEISTLLVGLAHKGETADEIAGAARAMRKFVTRIKAPEGTVFDSAGTGGDGKGTFNISTVAALVVAGAGVVVAKHGNRSVSGCCGSADILEALGVNITAEPAVVEKCLAQAGIGFLFAPKLHPAMGFVQPVRVKLRMRTIFNILGPLINPAFPTHQLIGVFDEKMVPVLGQALSALDVRHAMVVWGEGGFDEVTTTGKTFVCEVRDGHLREYQLEPEKFGLKRADVRDIQGNNLETSKHIVMNILKGMEGPERDIAVFNAGCGLYLAGRAHTIKEGMTLASEAIDSGAAIKKLNKLIEYTTGL